MILIWRKHTVKVTTIVLLVATKEDGLEASNDKIKYMFISSKQTAGKNHELNVIGAENTFENRAISNTVVMYGNDTSNQNCMHEETKSRLNSRKACYHFEQNHFSSLCYLNM
jgi:hypothetical protein